MEKILLKNIVDAVNGKFYGDKNILESYIKNINTDSRKKSLDSLFVPIIGENFDGHDFIEQAFENGALCSLTEKNINLGDITEKFLYSEKKCEHSFIKVESTKQALLDLAEYYRSLFNIKVIAITGSVGKTTTKDLIASVLSQSFEIIKTDGNFNNQIGLPLTVFNIGEKTQIAVLEMGTNHFGELESLSKVARPDVCVITNIGVSHIENFHNRNGIFKAKCEIFKYANKNFVAILNGDDNFLTKLDLPNKIFYGLDSKNNINPSTVSSEIIKVIKDICSEDFFVKNALATIAVGKYFDIEDEKIKSGLKNFRMPHMRMEILKAKNNITIINDVYNASPDSMRTAIDFLERFESNKISVVTKKKICILGDMFELGEYSARFHREIGEFLSKKKVDLIICIGEHAKNIFDMISGDKDKLYYKDKSDFFDALKNKNVLDDNSVILLKGSRGMHFEDITDKLMR